MKILLCEDVEKLGYLGDIVEVKEGYARNYLLPHGLAKAPSDANVKALADEKAARAEQRRLTRERLQTVAEAVNGAEAVVAAKANEQGHLFGSVAQHEIAENLRKQGFEIKDDMVRMHEHIKEVGTHEVKLRIAAELEVKVSVVVVSQDETIEPTDENIEK
ncbi:MAG: 50S ribosomal protein L9 [Sedimentisphaerales bacterium]|nr:50S ribosomal protein L9 [Sedimentisphaerales bacterium]